MERAAVKIRRFRLIWVYGFYDSERAVRMLI